MRHILAVTGTRADYGLMTPVYRGIVADPALGLSLIVTGMHHLPAFRSSLDEVRRDALCPMHEVVAAPRDDSPQAMIEAFGAMLSGMAPVIASAKADLLLLQGDRGEMLAAAIAASHLDIPIVHMSGGDRSGSVDDSLRHAISKFAHLHLTTCRESSERLVAMGEDPARIVEAGEPGLDLIRTFSPEPAEQLARELALDLSRPLLLATLHPVTSQAGEAPRQMASMLDALEQLGMQAVVTWPNADAGGGAMAEALEARRGRPWLRIVANLGSRRYLSLMKMAAAVVGNSSSGLIEAPAFRVPTVNIGSRQEGRTRAASVIDCGHDAGAIMAAVRKALGNPAFRAALAGCTNPYGDGHAAERTVDVLRRVSLSPALLAKWAPPGGQPLLEPAA